MKGSSFATWTIVAISFFIAILLMLAPLPPWALWLRPSWVTMVIIFWSLSLPSRFGVGVAWFIGLLVDLLQGTVLGEHALVFALIAYLVIKFQKRIYIFSMFQRTLTVLGLILLQQVLLFLIQGMMGQPPTVWNYWVAPFTSALFWPWIYNILKSCQRRFKIMDPTLTRLMFGRDS